MKRILLTATSLFLFSCEGWTQQSTTAPKPHPTQSASAKKSTATLKLGPKVMLWQEGVNSMAGSSPSEFPSQFYGMAVSLTYQKLLSGKRWYQSHSFDVMSGHAHASGNQTTSQDNLRNQPWYGFLLSPGILYRTTPISDVVFSIPLSYRKINWTDQAILKFEKESLFSYGLGLTAVLRMSVKTNLLTGVVYQVGWSSTMWTVGLDFSI